MSADEQSSRARVVGGDVRPGGTILRYLRVLRAYWAANLEEELQYRANFFASLASTVFWLLTAVLTAALFFGQTSELGGWSFWEVVSLLGVFNAVAGVVEAVLRPNIGRLVQLVRQGSLDFILVKPVDPQFQISFRRLVIWHVTDVVFGLALMAFAVTRMAQAPAPGAILAFGLSFAAGVAIVYSLWLALMTLAFWFVAVENLAVLFDALFESARFPVSAYPGALRFVLVYLLPMAWITTVPPSILTGRTGISTALVAAGVALATLALTRVLWRVALGRYTSAGG
jgi:ABC-2 type transport system permease protein